MKKVMLLGALIALAGCQQETQNTFDVKEVSNRTYLINQETGELSLVYDGRVLQLPKYTLPQDKLLKTNGSFSEKIQFNATTKQIEDRVYFTLNIEGYSSTKTGKDGKTYTEVADFEWFKPALEKNKHDFIKLQFMDSDGFKLTEETVKLSSRYTNVIGYDGKVTGLRYEDSFKVNPIVLSKAKTLHYVYRLDTLQSESK